MARRTELLAELYQRMQREVTSPQAWQKFLASACWNHRLSFEEQLLVYAQRPDATAVLEIERWNRRFGRWVNRGATGIPVFDRDYEGRSRLKYYFDISDTHPGRFSRPVPIWDMRPEYEAEITETLENSFGELSNKNTFAQALISAAKNAVQDNMQDYLSELQQFTADSFLEELDDLNVEVLYRNALQNSIAYMLLTRCGQDAGDYFDDGNFRGVINFNTPDTLNALGKATSDIGQMCLSEIARTALDLQKEAEKTNRTFALEPEWEYAVPARTNTPPERSADDERDRLHDGERVQDTELSAAPGAGDPAWEVRASAPEVPEAEPPHNLYEASDQRETEPAPDGDRREGPDQDRADHGADGESRGRDGGTESQRPDEMGGPDEQHQTGSGGNGTPGTDLRITNVVAESARGGELPALLDEKPIMALLANRENDLIFTKEQIELFFSLHTDAGERTEYIRQAYPYRFTEAIIDGERYGYVAQDDGLVMWAGSYTSPTRQSLFSWNLIAEWVGQIIDRQEYGLNTSAKKLPAQDDQQMLMFGFGGEEPASSMADDAQFSFLSDLRLPQQVIDEALCIGANHENSRLTICAWMMKDKPLEDNARFLREHYGTNGAGFYLNDRQYSVWYTPEGIRIDTGDTAQRSGATTLTWDEAARRIQELLDLGRYMPQRELDQAASHERKELADRLLYLYQDIEEDSRDSFLTVTGAVYNTRLGLPEESAAIQSLLEQPESLQFLVDEVRVFTDAYDKNRDILRFHYHRPHELLQRLIDLQREPVIFTAAEGYDPQRRFFISGDEIDRKLRGDTDYRLGVYAYFLAHPDHEERRKYLKRVHGEYSGSYNGIDNTTWTSKGLSFSHGSITAPYAKVELSWPKIEKRISAMFDAGAFLDDEDRAAMPDYEREQLARQIYHFFADAPAVFERPYPRDMYFTDAVGLIARALNDPSEVDVLYEMMLRLRVSTPQDDRDHDLRERVFKNITAYRDGTFSLFGEQKQPVMVQGTMVTTREESNPYPELAEDILRFFQAFDGPAYLENLKQSDEAAALESLEQRLHDPAQRDMIAEQLRAFLDHADPNEEIYGDLEIALEVLGELSEQDDRVDERSEDDFSDVDPAAVREDLAQAGIVDGKVVDPDALDADPFIQRVNRDVAAIAGESGEVEAPASGPGLPAEKETEDGTLAPAYDLGYGHMGNGFTVWNRLRMVDGDYQTVAHIAPDRSVTIYDADMPDDVRQRIYDIAATSDARISETQDAPVFSTPPQAREPVTPEAPAEKPTEAIPAPPPRRERVTFTTLRPEIPADQRRNFRITDPQLGYGTPSEKFASNVAAIRTLKRIEAEERLATPEEQEVLSRYVGWGGLADCFDERHSRYQELKSLLSEDEYAAARASSLTAFYTSPVIIEAMYKALAQMGFQSGNILEPACGVGNFIGMIPEEMAGSHAYGVEIDSISGRIAQQLYQNSSISVNGFEKVQMPDSFFDIAIGNVPFGDLRVADRKYDKYHWLIHDYFFGKALDKVRPGGIIAFISSKGTMDKESSAVRKYLAQRADLIGAIRLPDNAFKRNAGTEVTSDIIFLQKRDRLTDIEPDWVHLDTTEDGIRMNSYFVQHPEMVLGNMVMQSTRFGMDSACKAYEDADLSQLLAEAVANLHAEITAYEQDELDEGEDESIPADPTVRNFSLTIVGGKIYYRENSVMRPVKTSATAENRIRGMIALRDCVRRLIELQTENYPDAEIEAEQRKLNRLYDDFVRKYDRLNTRGNRLAFEDDSSYYLLCSLEVYDKENKFERKADMFTKRTIRPHEPVTHVDTAAEALAVSITERARVDMAYMSELSGKTPEELETELDGVIFRDVDCAEDPKDIAEDQKDMSRYPLVPADEYLSGNVRKKLRMARAMRDALPPEEQSRLDRNVAALEAVQPQDLSAGEIGVRIGANWVPISDYEDFMYELFGTSYYAQHRIKITHSKFSGEWNISHKTFDRGNIKVHTTYGTDRVNAYRIFEQTLNQKDVRVFDYVEDVDGKKKPVFNAKETAIAQDRQELIKQKFQEWIWKDIDRRERLCHIYNETFNSIRPREYDGSHLTFPGMNPEITLRPHQVNAIAHVIYGGNTLLAHEVGAGKTYEMAAAAMEMKRLGLCTKSLFVVPNHIIGQWASEFLQLYPAANLLVVTKKDFETANRKKICARIATGDYDAVIIGHSQLEKIPMSVARQRLLIMKQLDEITAGIADARKADGTPRYTIKQMEKTKHSLETRLEKLNDTTRKDNVVDFEELGIDRLFVDESHMFKNLYVVSKMRNVGGISQTDAQKSSDLFMKTQYLDELTGYRGNIFATGTPISNSMVELYTIQRYLQYQVLQEMGLVFFDDWASSFGETITAIELAPEGTGYRAKTRFAKFYNLPELMSTFKMAADIQTADMLKLPVPKANFHTEVISPSELQQEMVAGLAERAEEIRAGHVDPTVDNMLRVTNDGRKLALDMRLLQPLAPDDPDGKVARCARNVFQIWEQTKTQRSAQLVFCDLSTPRKDGGFDVYNDLKQKLMAKGVPEEEIAFIHDADTDARKQALFAKVRAGTVRVLMGSTQKMGAGTNCQDRLIALHDLDCPWRPSDLAQRLGRIVRQGNVNPEVEIFRYVTEGTFDSYLYQLVENKQRFISQIMTSKTPARVADDVDETALSYAEIKALATGNPLIIEKCELEMEVSKLQMLKAAYLNQRYSLESMVLRKYPAAIAELTEKIAGFTADCQRLEAHPKPKEGFVGMVIDGTAYTDKAEAGKALITKCTTMMSKQTGDFGEYRGFTLSIYYDALSKDYRLSMKGELSHELPLGADVFGNFTRMDNALEKLPERLAGAKDDLRDTHKQLDNARAELEASFAKEQELAQKSKRLNELNILLNLEQKDKTLIADTPDEDAPERGRSRDYER